MQANCNRPHAKQRRVLVVDDNPDAAESLATLLNLAGHDARVAFDGPTALQSISLDRPDVVLMDIGLPGMSGYDLARRLTIDYAQDPILLVALTGYCQDED